MANALGQIQLPDDTLAKLLATYNAPAVVSGGGPLGTIAQAQMGASLAQPTSPDTPALGSVIPQDNVPMPEQSSILGSVAAPTRASQDLIAAENKLQTDTPKPYVWGDHSLLGKIGHVAAGIGNVAGDILDPEATSLIPNSQLYKQRRVAQDTADVQQKTENVAAENKEQDAVDNETANRAERDSQFEAGAPERASKVALENAQSQVALHPTAKTPFDVFMRNNPNATAEQAANFASKPLDKDTAAALEKATGGHGVFKAGMPFADATALSTALNNQGKLQQGALRISIDRDKASTAAANVRNRDTEKEYNTYYSDWRKNTESLDKQSQAAQAAQEDISSGNIGQAMGRIKLLSSAASGAGSGVRITQTELGSLAAANGIKGDVSAFINRTAGNGPMSDPEKRQALAFAKAVIDKTQGKITRLNQGLDDLQGAASKDDLRKIDQGLRHDLYGTGGSGSSNNGDAPPAGAKVIDFTQLGKK